MRYRGEGGVWGEGVVGLLGRMEGGRVRGIIEISVRVRTLINSKFQMLLVKK